MVYSGAVPSDRALGYGFPLPEIPCFNVKQFHGVFNRKKEVINQGNFNRHWCTREVGTARWRSLGYGPRCCFIVLALGLVEASFLLSQQLLRGFC